MTVKIQARRDTAANWTSANPILSSGESGFEIDTNKLKIGDGSTAWNALAYFGAVAGLDTQIQFNTAGQFDASADFSYNPTTKQLSVADSVVVNAASGFVGNMLDLQVNGLSRAKVSDVGTLTTVTDGPQVNENYVYYGSGAGTLTHRVYAARGTSDAPSVSLNGDRLIGYACFPRLSTGFATGPGCRMQFVYRGDASLNTRATDIEFETSIGVASLWPRLGIVNTGGIWLQEDGFVSGTVRRVFLHSDGANIFSQRGGANPQTYRIYNTYTDASNYERGHLQWNSNVLEIGTDAAGTGTKRNLKLSGPSVSSSMTFSTAGIQTNDHVTLSSALRAGGNTVVAVNGTFQLGFTSTAVITSSVDTGLKRDQAGVVAITDGSTGVGYLKSTPVAVSALPAAATVGAGTRGFVSDSTVAASGNFGAAVTGGGSNNVPVFSDGTNWLIG